MPSFRRKSYEVEAFQYFDDMGTHTAIIPLWFNQAIVNGKIYVDNGSTFIRRTVADTPVENSNWIVYNKKTKTITIFSTELFKILYEEI